MCLKLRVQIESEYAPVDLISFKLVERAPKVCQITYRPLRSWPVPFTTIRIFLLDAHSIALATCSSVVALTIY